MIPVTRQPEPARFDNLVRQPGRALLDRSIPQRSREFSPYWREIDEEIYRAYGGICAYTCIYLVADATVDHFLPKLKFPNLAYEWDNYRLASSSANQKKGDQVGILDPFSVRREWFALDFPSCLVAIGLQMPERMKNQGKTTIKTIGIERLRFCPIQAWSHRAILEEALESKYVAGHVSFYIQRIGAATAFQQAADRSNVQFCLADRAHELARRDRVFLLGSQKKYWADDLLDKSGRGSYPWVPAATGENAARRAASAYLLRRIPAVGEAADGPATLHLAANDTGGRRIASFRYCPIRIPADDRSGTCLVALRDRLRTGPAFRRVWQNKECRGRVRWYPPRAVIRTDAWKDSMSAETPASALRGKRNKTAGSAAGSGAWYAASPEFRAAKKSRTCIFHGVRALAERPLPESRIAWNHRAHRIGEILS